MLEWPFFVMKLQKILKIPSCPLERCVFLRERERDLHLVFIFSSSSSASSLIFFVIIFDRHRHSIHHPSSCHLHLRHHLYHLRLHHSFSDSSLSFFLLFIFVFIFLPSSSCLRLRFVLSLRFFIAFFSHALSSSCFFVCFVSSSSSPCHLLVFVYLRLVSSLSRFIFVFLLCRWVSQKLRALVGTRIDCSPEEESREGQKREDEEQKRGTEWNEDEKGLGRRG